MQCIKKWKEECDNPTKTQNMGRSSLKAYCLYRQVTAITERGENSEGREKAFSASGRKLKLPRPGCCWLSPCCQQPPSFRAVTGKGQPARAKEAKPDKAAFDVYMGKHSCRWSLGASDSRAAARAQVPSLAASCCSLHWAWHHISLCFVLVLVLRNS